MEQSIDKRLMGACVYCGGRHNSKDHIPSKILLDGEIEENWHTVNCCTDCNQSFSGHEEFIACLIECMIHNSVESSQLSREKIKKILQKKPGLADRIHSLLSRHPKRNILIEEKESFDTVILKTARGHVHYELGETVYNSPKYLLYNTIDALTQRDIDIFNQNPKSEFLPEVASRALSRLFLHDNTANSGWVMIKEGAYRFCVVDYGDLLIVKFVLWDYLFAQVVWEDS